MKNYIFPLILACFISCKTKQDISNYENVEIITVKSFKTPKKLSATLIPLYGSDGTQILGVSEFATTNDLICLSSSYEEMMLKVFDTTGKLIRELIPNGKANNEMLIITQLGYNDISNTFWTTDPTSRKIISYNADTLYRSPLINPTYESVSLDYPGGSQKAYLMNDIIINAPIMVDQKRFTYFDKNGKFIKTIGQYPICKDVVVEDNMLLSELWNWCFTSNGTDRIAICARYADLMSIYDMQGNIIRQILGPNTNSPQFKTDVSGRNGSFATIIPTRPDQGNYIDIVSRDNMIWLYYAHKDENGNVVQSDVLTFDWDGRPIARYILDKIVHRIDVMPESKTIYGLDRAEGLVYKFKY